MRFIALPFALALLGAPALAAPSFRDSGPVLTLPDGSILQLPPTARSFGRDERAAPPAAEPTLRPPPPAPPPPPLSAAERRKQRLDDLYARLAEAKDATESQAIGAMIADIFLHSGSDTADLLMERAVTAMDGKDLATASALLDKLVALRPGWAEAWNKRATVRYLDNDDVGSMGDIGQVLVLEPRHFGALSGMGLILHRNGDERGALTVLRKAHAIDPQDAQVQSLIEELAPEVEGHAL